MGDDEYHPISQKGSNLTAAGGIGYTVVDSIDTMLLMGLNQEYSRAREWVASKMSFERNATFNTFEVSASVHCFQKLTGLADNYSSVRWPPLRLSSYRGGSYLSRESYRACGSDDSCLQHTVGITIDKCQFGAPRGPERPPLAGVR